MKTDRKRWRPSPPLVVVTTAMIVIASIILLGWLNARSYRVKARVEIADPAVDVSAVASLVPSNVSGLPDGEVARMATRVREATGLLMGLTMLTVNEQMNNRVLKNVESLINLTTQRNLFPPGVNRTATQGVLSSGRATIYVRYRPLPLGVEVVSIGRERLDGPTVIARLTAGADDNSGALLLVARRVEGVRLPEPVAPLADIAALKQMTKYKQAVAIISNAPPVRLTYPKFAKTEAPPLSKREIRFQRTGAPKSLVTPSNGKSPESSITQTLAIHREKAEPERPQNPEAGKTTQARWKEANTAITVAPSQKMEFEPEYDPNSLDEEQMPLFDLGSREL